VGSSWGEKTRKHKTGKHKTGTKELQNTKTQQQKQQQKVERRNFLPNTHTVIIANLPTASQFFSSQLSTTFIIPFWS
jgi:hypothetical protein